MRIATLTIAAAAWLCTTAWAKAEDLALNDNPYTPIVTRNIFGLLPVPTNDPTANAAPVVPPPKISLNGITTILGSKEALYKVATPAKPGVAAADQSYMMGEGESQDDIQVVKIDTDADVVTFNNHGTIQQLPLTAAGNISSGPAGGGVSSPTGGGAPGLPLPGNRFRRPGGPGFGGRAPAGGANPSSSPDTGAAPVAAGPSNPQIYNPGASELSPEAEALLIENNYNNAKGNGDKPGLASPAMFPPTALRGQSDAPEPNQGAETQR